MEHTREQAIEQLVSENRRRHNLMFGPYAPITGEGCYGFISTCSPVHYASGVMHNGYPEGIRLDPGTRVRVEIPDFFIPCMWIPVECLDILLLQQVIQYGSIKDYIERGWQKEYNDKLHSLVTFELCKLRFREDPEFALFVEDKIEDKATGNMIPFRLNFPQRKLLAIFERQRHKKKAIRVVVLKARQWGGSTLTQLYMKWIQDHRHDGWNSVILAQVKGASKKIKAMYRKAIEHQPGWTIGRPGDQLQLSPFENSTDDFIVTNGTKSVRRSTLTIASFDTFDNVRGSNFHMAHYSEVAYWKKTPEHDPEGVISSIHGGIKNIEDNIEVYESTGRGASGFFYDKCQLAMDPDNNDANEFLFIPFFDIELNQEPVDDEYAFAAWLYDNREKTTCPKGWREEGKFFWKIWRLGATFEAINWYRIERNNYKSHAFMATEAPIDENEAFRNSGNLIFNPYSIDELQQAYQRPPKYYANITLAPGNFRAKLQIGKAPSPSPANSDTTEGSTSALQSVLKYKSTILQGASINYVSKDEASEMKIWALPNNNILKVRNRYVVAVDIGGASNSSDYTVMTVIDRLGMVPGMHGHLTVAARWRAHCRHDILAWKAAALAHYYDNALLVIESNTADRERNSNTEGDHFGTIIEEISNYYPNLYMRSAPPEKATGQITRTYGFQTNKLTKGWLIDNLIACVDDKLWEEPDKEMYHELRIYERKEDNTMGNIEGSGNHDDVLMSTAIALWIAMTDMPKPDWKRTAKASTEETSASRLRTEADI